MSKPVKYLLIISSVLFLLILIPGLIPLDKYKSLISTQVQNATGRKLTINGKISLSILPRPKVKIEDIKLDSLPEASYPYVVELKTAEAAIAISPLLFGKIVISYIELDNPKLTVEKLKNGKGTWELENKNVLATTQANNHEASKTNATKTNDLPFNVERIIVNNGEVQYLQGGSKTTVQDLNLSMKVENIKGPIDFGLAFKILDQDVNLNGRLKEISNLIPLYAELKTQGEHVKLDGVVNVDNSSFKGDISANGNLKNIKLIETSALPGGLKEEHKFSAKLEANKAELKCSAIDFQIGKLNAKGQANYEIDKTTGTLDLALNPGNIIINIAPLGTVDGFSNSKIQLKANSIRPILEALEVDLKSLPEFLSQTFSIVANLKYKDQALLLQDIDFNLGNANLQGAVGAKNWSGDLSIPYDLKTKNGTALLNLTGTTLPFSISDLQVKGETSQKNQIIKTNTTISLLKSNIHINGDAHIGKGIEPDLSVNIGGYSLAETISQLTGKPSIKNLGGFDITAKVQGDINKEISIGIENFSVFLAREKTNLSGKANLKLDGDKPKISLDLLISAVNLDLLADNSSSSSSAASNVAVSPAKRNHWSNEKINLSFMDSFSGDFNLAIQKISSGSLIFDNFKAKLHLSNGILNLDSLTGNLYGGKIEATAKVASHKNGSSDISLKASLNDAQLKNIVPTQGKFKVTSGELDFNADIKTKGDSQNSWINNLQGVVNLNGNDGILSGFDLQKIINTLNNVRNLQGVLKVLDNSFLKGETAFKTLENKLEIENGIAKLATSKVVAKGGEANATGIIDLPKYSLDINAEVKVDVKNMPTFKTHLYGQIDNPQYNLDTKALQQYLINNVLTGVIDSIKSGKTRPEDILKEIIGGSKKNRQEDSQPQNEQSEPEVLPEKNEVNKLINKGLKSLFK